MPTIRTELWDYNARGRAPYWAQAKFLFVRTKLDIENIGDELDAFYRSRDGATHLAFYYGGAIGKDTLSFDNGFVALIYTPATVSELAAVIGPTLEWCDAWAIVGSGGDVAEKVTGGPVSTFVRSCSDLAIAIFSYVDEAAVPMLAKDVTGALPDQGRGVFHFKDGLVVFWNTKRPARLIAQQIAPRARLSEMWVVIDREGDDYGGEQGRALNLDDQRLGWWLVNIDDLVVPKDYEDMVCANPFLSSRDPAENHRDDD